MKKGYLKYLMIITWVDLNATTYCSLESTKSHWDVQMNAFINYVSELVSAPNYCLWVCLGFESWSKIRKLSGCFSLPPWFAVWCWSSYMYLGYIDANPNDLKQMVHSHTMKGIERPNFINGILEPHKFSHSHLH